MVQQFTLSLRKVYEITKGNIGLDDYPVFEGAPEGFREALNAKILNHYYTREIGMENVELWRFHMRRLMNEIMPFYNKVYKAELREFDPLSTIDIVSTGKAENETVTDSSSKSKSDASTKNKSITVGSQFPQTMVDMTGDTFEEVYATDATRSASEGDTLSNGEEEQLATVKGNDDTTSSTKGYTGPASELLMRYRASLINPDIMVIADLNEMFMSVYSSGDSFTGSRY
jgi:hypothetical protein